MEDKYAHYEALLAKLSVEGVRRTLPELDLRGKYVRLDGRLLLNLSGNGYLGLSASGAYSDGFDPMQAQWTSASSRLLTGNDTPYTRFETLLRDTYGVESALIWESGYHANSGWLPTLADANTLIVADRLVHASIIEGIRLSKAPFIRFRHNDLVHLREVLATEAPRYRRVWIVTEALFSMDGDLAPLREIVALKREYPNTFLYVDEAHSVGVYGEKGLGYAVEQGVLPEVDILVATLGKALGSVGAYSLQRESLRSLAVSTSRPFIYSTALPPVSVAWSEHIFRLQMQMDERRRHLRALRTLVADKLGISVPSQIVPIIAPGNDACTTLADRLIDAGYYVRPIRRPTVPAGQERIRLSLTADMTHDEVNDLCDHLIQILREK